jgi:hypothetical protein
MEKKRILILVVVLVLMPGVWSGTARTTSASIPSHDPISLLGNQDISTHQNNAPVLSSRSPLDECFDVPLSELTGCRNASKAPIRHFRSQPDECFDVPLSELTGCRNADKAATQHYRSPLYECFDVPLSKLTSCRDASQTSSYPGKV